MLRAPAADDWDFTLELSEIFSSVQGEGASAGEACLFVRLALCNLRCGFCDTKYTWDFKAHRYEEQVRTIGARELFDVMVGSAEKRVVVTGGEPLVHGDALSRLMPRVPREIAVEVETNGTILPSRALLDRIDQWNVSPKLAHSGEPERRRIVAQALTGLRDSGKAWLKLVVRGEADAEEADALVRSLEWPRDRVLLMPEVTRRCDYEARAESVQSLSGQLGYRFSPRLHVLQWNGERGR